MKTTTEDLLRELKKTNNIHNFLNMHEKDFHKINSVDYLNELICTKK